MALVDQVIEIFEPMDPDGHVTISIDRFERSEIGTILVKACRFGHAILGDRFLKVTPGGRLALISKRKKVNGVAVLSVARRRYCHSALTATYILSLSQLAACAGETPSPALATA